MCTVLCEREVPAGRLSQAGAMEMAQNPWTNGGLAYERLGDDERRIIDLFAGAQVGVAVSTVARRKYIVARAVWVVGFTTSRIADPLAMASKISAFPVTTRTIMDIKCTLTDWQEWCNGNEDTWKTPESAN